MMISAKPLRPSSQRRLERWARALRIADDERLRKSIDRRFDAEFRRGNLPGDVIDAIEHELERGEEYRLAELACARIAETDEYKARLQALQETQWRKMLTDLWSKPYVPLTSCAYFVATDGEPREPDDDALEAGSAQVVSRLQDGALPLHGREWLEKEGKFSAFRSHIPLEHVREATADGAPIYDDRPIGEAPRLAWAIIPDDGEDEIRNRYSVLWTALVVWREDMQRLVKADTDRSPEPAADEPASNGQDAPRKTTRVGRTPKLDWKMVEDEVCRLMEHHGEFDVSDPDWNCQARLEEAVEGYVETTFGVNDAPRRSTIRVHVKSALETRRRLAGN
jgi:hypothetical protein